MTLVRRAHPEELESALSQIDQEQRTAPPGPPPASAPLTHRQIMETLTGLLTGMFVTILSSTIVANALPTIITDLHAGQTAYSWVITATLLAMTVTVPIWGKLSDLFDRKLLVQLSLAIFVVGSVAAGLAGNASELIAARVVQGVGAGGMSALTQTILALMVAPRERGRYSGYFGGIFALGTVVGPLVGGAIVDTSWLGWRWCFFIGIPVAVIAMAVLQRTLRLPQVKRQVSVDWRGALLVAASAALLLIWVSFAGQQYAWLSWQTAAMVAGALVLAGLFLRVEATAKEPIIPLHLFRDRTVCLAVGCSLLVGVSMYCGTTFLSQYFQMAQGKSPTIAGLLTLPMVLGLALISLLSGRLITRTGRWRPVLLVGSVLGLAGVALLATARADTAYGLLALYMFLFGAGLGMTMQNLVLAVQNQVRSHEMGAASATVAFTRTLGGAMGVSALGALMAIRLAHYTAAGLARLGVHGTSGNSGSSLPSLSTLSGPVRAVVEHAYGHSVGDVFLFDTPLAVIAVIAVLFIREVPLRSAAAPAALPEPAPEDVVDAP